MSDAVRDGRSGADFVVRAGLAGLVRAWVPSLALVLVACASMPPKEPPTARQLWTREGCFAHILPEWRHLEGSRLTGAVFTAGSTKADSPIPTAVVFVRPWPDGEVTRSAVSEQGDFGLPHLKDGLYEVAVCADGWNPWRGTVRITRGTGTARELAFPLELGQ